MSILKKYFVIFLFIFVGLIGVPTAMAANVSVVPYDNENAIEVTKRMLPGGWLDLVKIKVTAPDSGRIKIKSITYNFDESMTDVYTPMFFDFPAARLYVSGGVEIVDGLMDGCEKNPDNLECRNEYRQTELSINSGKMIFDFGEPLVIEAGKSRAISLEGGITTDFSEYVPEGELNTFSLGIGGVVAEFDDGSVANVDGDFPINGPSILVVSEGSLVYEAGALNLDIERLFYPKGELIADRITDEVEFSLSATSNGGKRILVEAYRQEIDSVDPQADLGNWTGNAVFVYGRKYLSVSAARTAYEVGFQDMRVALEVVNGDKRLRCYTAPYAHLTLANCKLVYKNIMIEADSSLYGGLSDQVEDNEIQFLYNTFLVPMEARLYELERELEAIDLDELPVANYLDDVLVDFAPYVTPFPDVDTELLSGKAAAELYRRNVIGGYPNGEFGGDGAVNRAELAKMLLMARYSQVRDIINNGRFSDVVSGEWYVPFVMDSVDRGIMKGDPGGTMRPGDGVNTAEFLAMLIRTFGIEEDLPHAYEDITDAWIEPYAGAAEKYNLFPDRSINKLEPGRKLTRNEVAVAIYQYLKSEDR